MTVRSRKVGIAGFFFLFRFLVVFVLFCASFFKKSQHYLPSYSNYCLFEWIVFRSSDSLTR